MKPTDYDMVKLAFDSVDLLILRSQTQVRRRMPAAGLIDTRPRPAG